MYLSNGITAENPCSEIDDDISKEERVHDNVKGEPSWLQLVIAVECNTDRKDTHGEQQQTNNYKVPVKPAGKMFSYTL